MKNFKLKSLFLLCRTIYKSPNLFKNREIKEFNVQLCDIEYLKNTTFSVIKVNIENKFYYFRECRRHITFSKYLESLFHDFCCFVHPHIFTEKEKNEINLRFKKKRTIKLIYRLGIANDPSSNIYKFFKNECPSHLGLDGLKIDIEKIKCLAQYLWGEVYLYRLNAGTKNNEFQCFNSSRQLATKAVANSLNISFLVPEVSLCKLIIDNQSPRYGTLMEEAPGLSPTKLNMEERKKVTPEFQRQCSCLNILDAITFEKDHRPANYMVEINQFGEINKLQAFDNDSPKTFWLSSSIRHTSYCGSSPVTNKYGIINIPYMDKRLYDSIVELSYSQIFCILKDILTSLQIKFVWKRITKMKNAFQKTLKINPGFLLDTVEWNQNTLTNEINNYKYVGYLKIFCEKQIKEIVMGNQLI